MKAYHNKIKSGRMLNRRCVIASALAFTVLNLFIMPSMAVPSAEERMRREGLNAREHLTLKQVKAAQFDLKGKTFLLKLFINTDHDLEQVAENRFEYWIESSPGDGGVQLIHFPRAGVVNVGKSIQQGDVVIVRIKEGEASLTLECLGVSDVNVWQ